MKNGKIKWIGYGKGYGFIVEDETGDEFFVHVNDLADRAPGNRHPVNGGDRVTFDVGSNDKGPIAVNVRRTD